MFTEIPLSVLSNDGLRELLILLKDRSCHRFNPTDNMYIQKAITDIELEYVRRADQITAKQPY